MRKKIFFLVGTLGAGGAERVFWLLSQGFNQELYEITLVLYSSREATFSMDLRGVRMIDLNTQKASRSFFKLYSLIRAEKPYAVYSTVGQNNILLSLVSFFAPIPNIIARGSNIPDQSVKFNGKKSSFWTLFVPCFYRRFKAIVCQSEEMKCSFLKVYHLDPQKIALIPNPVLNTGYLNTRLINSGPKRIIIVARLTQVKGHDRLLEIFRQLPVNYLLTIAGDGPLKEEIQARVKRLNLEHRVQLIGEVSNAIQLIAEHNVLVLSSYTEGFPNVVLEALSVGTPVVTFRVGGITGLILDGFNGYVVEQGDTERFKERIIEACSQKWDAMAIKQDVFSRYSLQKVALQYEELVL